MIHIGQTRLNSGGRPTVIISFSGGRTSAYLVHLAMLRAKEQGWIVRFIFMDTGGEHPATYQFLRDLVKHWGIDLECIRIVVNPKLRGKGGNGWVRVPVDQLSYDLQYMKSLVQKLGTFTKGQAHCTRDMKRRTFDKYVKDTTSGPVQVWLGMRYDEPSRIWGKVAYKALRDEGLSPDDCAWLWADAVSSGDITDVPEKARPRLLEHAGNGRHYLAEISDFEKADILKWWRQQPFDLQIEEHLGNCVFCVKKNAKKIALACRDEPELMVEWQRMHMGDHVRTENLPSRDPAMSAHIYQDSVTGKPVTMAHIIAMFEPYSRDELYRQMKFSGGEDTGSCSESCEVFNDENATDDD